MANDADLKESKNFPKHFNDLPLKSEILEVLQVLGISEMTPIQALSLPVLLGGRDLVGQSQTGSGKTFAYAIPALEKIDLEIKELQVLVLGPTRELCTQVTREMRSLGRGLLGLQVLSLVGGEPLHHQKASLLRGVHVVVGTPGRILDLMERIQWDWSHLKMLVLDEADRMLDMGFTDQVSQILKTLPVDRQTAFFSATYPDSMEILSQRFQRKPKEIKIGDGQIPTPDIEQILYESPSEEEKLNILFRVLQQHPGKAILVFCNQKQTAAQIGAALAKNQVKCGSLHGDLEQADRIRELALFRNGSSRILVATDVAARGLDIDNLDLVVNFDLPVTSEIYIHRIGRTGRAGAPGVAISLATPTEALKIHGIEEMTGVKFQRPSLGFKNQYGLNLSQHSSPWATLKISGGRKDKLRPGDILGALTSGSGKGLITAADVGQIEIHDQITYVAISTSKIALALTKLSEGKIKGRKFRIYQVK